MLLCASASRRRRAGDDRRQAPFLEALFCAVCVHANGATPYCTVVGCASSCENAAAIWMYFLVPVFSLRSIIHAKCARCLEGKVMTQRRRL